jgi:hypothetical protein
MPATTCNKDMGSIIMGEALGVGGYVAATRTVKKIVRYWKLEIWKGSSAKSFMTN